MSEHKEKPSKDSKEHKSAFKEPSREHNKSSKESSKKPKENKPLKDEKIVPKMAFKEPKPMSKEPKSENSILTITGGQQQEKKAPTKRPPTTDSEELTAKKRKKSSSEALFRSFSSAPSLVLTCSSDKKQIRDKSHLKMGKVKMESETLEKKKPTLPPFDDIVDPNDSDMEENMSSKSEVSVSCFCFPVLGCVPYFSSFFLLFLSGNFVVSVDSKWAFRSFVNYAKSWMLTIGYLNV
uniref:MLLT3 super elongation complex subunit n=1 Tax=Chelonoidis abingdonii TaxID=106734 RepID=A0A8C0HCM9_CHEAB